ncbi:MAG: hypothetical protein GQ564_22485 [Bacteroidales bacterium]|nr:hypothetical protein [Bacteroidales bacterium]
MIIIYWFLGIKLGNKTISHNFYVVLIVSVFKQLPYPLNKCFYKVNYFGGDSFKVKTYNSFTGSEIFFEKGIEIVFELQIPPNYINLPDSYPVEIRRYYLRLNTSIVLISDLVHRYY